MSLLVASRIVVRDSRAPPKSEFVKTSLLLIRSSTALSLLRIGLLIDPVQRLTRDRVEKRTFVVLWLRQRLEHFVHSVERTDLGLLMICGCAGLWF